jgi:hypothetical protein
MNADGASRIADSRKEAQKTQKRRIKSHTKTQRGIAATDVVRLTPDYVGQERAQRTQKRGRPFTFQQSRRPFFPANLPKSAACSS